jgi:hypothetical protein
VPAGFRDPVYLDWIRRLPCVACRPAAIERPWAHEGPVAQAEAHHLLTDGHALGRREPDAFAVPLCRRHHAWADHVPPGSAVWTDDGGMFRTPPLIEAVKVNLWYAAARLRWFYLQGGAEECGI